MRYRKNIKGGEKKIIDQKAILKTVSRGTALFLAAVLFAGSILTGCASTEKSSKSRKNNGIITLFTFSIPFEIPKNTIVEKPGHNSKEVRKSPKTGDENRMDLWLVMLCVFGIAVVTEIVIYKRRNR